MRKTAISKKQKYVIGEMRKGAHIIKMITFNGGAFLSNGNFDRVNISTWAALIDKKLIQSTGRNFPKENFILTELGKTITFTQ